MSLGVSGVLAPVVTPFHADLSVDAGAFREVCVRLLDEGAHGLAVFGTTSEANALALTERMRLLEGLIEGGIDPACLYPGTGLCALPETVELTRHAVAAGCAGVLMLPPFYYKPLTEDGLVRYYSEVVERVGDASLRVLLYHIPQTSGVPIPIPVIRRLITSYPDTVVGIKDSSGDWDTTVALLEALPGFAVFPSSEAMMTRAAALGAAGCISATVNVNARGIRALYDAVDAGGPEAADLQRRATAVRSLVTRYPLVQAVKAIVADRLGRPGLALTRPPLEPLDEGTRRALLTELATLEREPTLPAV